MTAITEVIGNLIYDITHILVKLIIPLFSLFHRSLSLKDLSYLYFFSMDLSHLGFLFNGSLSLRSLSLFTPCFIWISLT